MSAPTQGAIDLSRQQLGFGRGKSPDRVVAAAYDGCDYKQGRQPQNCVAGPVLHLGGPGDALRYTEAAPLAVPSNHAGWRSEQCQWSRWGNRNTSNNSADVW